MKILKYEIKFRFKTKDLLCKLFLQLIRLYTYGLFFLNFNAGLIVKMPHLYLHRLIQILC